MYRRADCRRSEGRCGGHEDRRACAQARHFRGDPIQQEGQISRVGGVGGQAGLHEKLLDPAHQRRRFGYRRLHILQRRDGITINRQKTQRLYRENGSAMRRRKERKHAIGSSATAPVSGTSISGRRIVRELNDLIVRRGKDRVALHHPRQGDPERVRRELQRTDARRVAQRHAIHRLCPCPREDRGLERRLQHRAAALFAGIRRPGGIRCSPEKARGCFTSHSRWLRYAAPCFTHALAQQRCRSCNRDWLRGEVTSFHQNLTESSPPMVRGSPGYAVFRPLELPSA